MPLSKFKPGDRIRLDAKGAVGMAAKEGAIAIVQDPPYQPNPYGSPYVLVTWVRDKLSRNQADGGYHDGNFDLVLDADTSVPTSQNSKKIDYLSIMREVCGG